MPKTAASATRIRKELTPISTKRGSILMSGCGGGGPAEKNSRQMPAKKQKALNRASTVPAAVFGDNVLQRRFGADAPGERREAGAHPGGIGPLGGKDIAVGGKLGAPLGRILDLARGVGERPGRF